MEQYITLIPFIIYLIISIDHVGAPRRYANSTVFMAPSNVSVCAILPMILVWSVVDEFDKGIITINLFLILSLFIVLMSVNAIGVKISTPERVKRAPNFYTYDRTPIYFIMSIWYLIVMAGLGAILTHAVESS